jgi:hypothetical protein
MQKARLARHKYLERRATNIIYRGLEDFVMAYPNSDGEVIVSAYQKAYRLIMEQEASATWNEYVSPILNVEMKSVSTINTVIWRRTIERFFSSIVRAVAESVSNSTTKLLQALDISSNTPQNERNELLLQFLESQKGRAINLGRTATTHGMARGALMAMASSNLPWKKSWVSFEDDKTRNSHRNMNPSEFINLDQNFTVGGQAMLFPADASQGASLDNIVNCRCGLAFKIGR